MKNRLLALLIVPLLAGLLAGCDGNVTVSIKMTNDERESRGMHPLLSNATLEAKAQQWADALAAQGVLVHSNLAAGVGSGWSSLGENLALASSIGQAHEELMHSAPHRANILNGTYSQIGVGVAQAPNGTIFVVQEFGG